MSKDNIESLLELHKKLATRYKEFETTDGEVPPVVVLNEMRYALRATIKLLSQASFSHIESEKEKETLKISLQECSHALRNAYHDLVDGILIQISRMIDNLLDKYPIAAVNVLGDRRLKILEDINEVEKSIATTRGEGMKRQEIYEVEIYEKYFKTIIKHYQFIDQVALMQIIREHDTITKKDKSNDRKFIVVTILSISTFLAAVIFGTLKIIGS